MKLPLTRRGFLGAAVVSPAVAKEAMNEAAATLADVTAVGPHAWNFEADSDISENPAPGSKLQALIKSGIPQWKKDELRKEARDHRVLDIDLAVMRSMSLSAKLQIQWRRNYEREVAQLDTTIRWSEIRKDWLKKHDLKWF